MVQTTRGPIRAALFLKVEDTSRSIEDHEVEFTTDKDSKRTLTHGSRGSRMPDEVPQDARSGGCVVETVRTCFVSGA